MLQIFQALNLQCASSLSSSPSSPPARRCRLAAAVSTCTRKCFLCLLTRVEWVARRRRRSRRMTWVFSLVRRSSVGRLAGGATRKRNRRSSAVAPGLQCRGEFFTLGVASLDVSLRKWFLKREMAGGGVRRAQDKKETGDGDKSCHCQQVDCRRRSSSPPPSPPRRRLAPCFALCIHADVPMRHSLLCETRSSLFTPPRVR